MAAPETTNIVTVRKLTSLMSQFWTKIKNALNGKQDDLGISSSGDTTKFLNKKGQWATPAGTAQVQSDWSQTSTTAVDYIKNKPLFNYTCSETSNNTYGFKFLTFSNSGSTTYGSIEGILTISQESGANAFSFYVEISIRGDVVRPRISRLSDTGLRKSIEIHAVKRGNYTYDFYVVFDSATTYCSCVFMPLTFVRRSSFSLYEPVRLTSAYSETSHTYANNRMMVKCVNNAAVGSTDKPVYVNDSGEVVPCTYGISVGYSSANNTICFY